MKTILGIILSFFILTAQAMSFETALGVSQFNYAHDGSTWYQDPFPHTLHLTSPSLSIGASQRIWHINWHAGWQFLGDVRSHATATTGPDFDFTHYPTATFIGAGTVRGFYTNAEYEWGVRGYTVGAGLGIYIYKPSWQVDIADYRSCFSCPVTPIHVVHDPKWQNTPTFSFSVGKGKDAMVLTYLHHVTAEGDQWPALYDVHRNSFLGKAGLYGMWNLGWRRAW